MAAAQCRLCQRRRTARAAPRRPRIHALSGADRRLAARSRSTRASSSGSRTTPSRRRARASSRRAGSIRTRTTNKACAISSAPFSTATRSGPFLESFEHFARRTALLGALNSLTQLVLKATMPGVPDFYQGTETWDLSLVDPDNRRPVDFAARQPALSSTSTPRRTGTLWPALDRRADQARAHPTGCCRCGTNAGSCFATALTSRSRSPVRTATTVAFGRSTGREQVIVVVARHLAGMTGNGAYWPRFDMQAELVLDPRDRAGLYDVFGGRAVRCQSLKMSHLLAHLPVAILRQL